MDYGAMFQQYKSAAYSGIQKVIDSLCEAAKVLQGPVDLMGLEQKVAISGPDEVIFQERNGDYPVSSNGHSPSSPPRNQFNRGQAYDPMIDAQNRGHHNRYNPNGGRATHSRALYDERKARRPDNSTVITYKERGRGANARSIMQEIPRKRLPTQR